MLKKSTVVKAKSFKDGLITSPVIQRSFYLIDEDINGLEYKYYEGSWALLPDFNSLTEIRKGQVYNLN